MQNRTVKIGDKEYKLSKLTRSIEKEFVEWVKEHTESPLLTVAKVIKDYPEHLQKDLMVLAWEEERIRLDFDSPAIDRAKNTLEGSSKLLQLMLQEAQPDLSHDETFQLSVQWIEQVYNEQKAKLKEASPDASDEELDAAVQRQQLDFFR